MLLMNIYHLFFSYRITFEHLLNIFKQLGFQCSQLLRRNDIMNSLKTEKFDLVIVEAFECCLFLVAEKPGKPFVSTLPSSFGTVDFGLQAPCLMCQCSVPCQLTTWTSGAKWRISWCSFISLWSNGRFILSMIRPSRSISQKALGQFCLIF